MTKTFEAVAGMWKADKRQWVKPASYATYVILLNKHLLPFFSGKESISESEIQAYVNAEIASGLCRKSIRDSLAVLKMILQYAEKTAGWLHVPFGVRFPKSSEVKEEVSVFSHKQQKVLHKYLQEHISFSNLGLLISMQSGLRIGEVCGLQWRDLDILAGIMKIRKTVQRIWLSDGPERENYLLVASPKTLSSVRDIPLSREVTALLRPLKRLMPDDCYLVSNSTVPMEPRRLRAHYRGVLRELGLPPLRFHALRHNFATRCIEAGCDCKTVSAILGHSSVTTTMNLYVHPDNGAKRQVIEKAASRI